MTCCFVAGVFASLEAGRGLGEVGVNTLVLSRLPADALPYLFIGLGAISLVIALAYGPALGRMRRARLFGLVLLGVAALLGIERVILATGSTAILPAVWLTVMAAGTVAGTIGWTVAASSFDARQAKRLFPLCTAAAIIGYFVGSLASGPVAAVLGAESLIAAEAVLFVVAAVLIARVARPRRGQAGRLRRPERIGRRRAPGRVRLRPALPADAPRGRRLCPVLGAGVLGDVPVPARGQRGVPDRGRAGDGARGGDGDGHGGLARRVARRRQPLLRPVRDRASGPRPADRLPRRLRGLDRQLLVRDCRRVRVRPAGHPARPLERRLERLLQRGPGRRAGPRSSPSRTASRVRSGRPSPASCCSRRPDCSRPTRSSGSVSRPPRCSRSWSGRIRRLYARTASCGRSDRASPSRCSRVARRSTTWSRPLTCGRR